MPQKPYTTQRPQNPIQPRGHHFVIAQVCEQTSSRVPNMIATVSQGFEATTDLAVDFSDNKNIFFSGREEKHHQKTKKKIRKIMMVFPHHFWGAYDFWVKEKHGIKP